VQQLARTKRELQCVIDEHDTIAASWPSDRLEYRARGSADEVRVGVGKDAA